jgi:2-polyprenyl-6-methoxyphenol hydroxylase-like FAD-dependent oxidoreductase
VVETTAQPFAQAIRDLASDHMMDRRVAIIGDAAAIPRPHTAASTSKAAVNALALTDALQAVAASIPISKDLKLATTCCSTGHRSRG